MNPNVTRQQHKIYKISKILKQNTYVTSSKNETTNTVISSRLIEIKIRKNCHKPTYD